VKQNNNNIMNNKNMNKMANFSFLILLSFHLILTSGPIFIAKNHQRVVFSWWMLFKAGFRCVFC